MRNCILVVEDDRATREALRGLLRDAGYEVMAAENGAAALGAIDSTRTPDLVLLDLNMPYLDGKGFLDCLRARPESTQTPVVVVTGVHRPSVTDGNGSVRVVQKPFDANTLLEMIRLLIAQRHAAARYN
jgi:two-component system chemotaxis sensor kinase CheA